MSSASSSSDAATSSSTSDDVAITLVDFPWFDRSGVLVLDRKGGSRVGVSGRQRTPRRRGLTSRQIERGDRTDHDHGGRVERLVAELVEPAAQHDLVVGGRRSDRGDRCVGRAARRRESAAMAARWVTPIRITIVPPTLASDRQSTSCSPARRCPVTTVNAADMPRWVTGTPAAAGAATLEVMPGTISNSTPCLLEGERFLSSPSEHERVAALQPHDPLAVLPELDEQRVDQLLWGRPAGSFADIDELGRRAGRDRARRRRRARRTRRHRRWRAGVPHAP